MGSCFSGSRASADHHKSATSLPPTANVVSLDGELLQYSIPITASQVILLHSQLTSATSSGGGGGGFFLCSSDSLDFDSYIPALPPHHCLDPSQIYFLLPVSKLKFKLTATDMAALAVKAASALQKGGASPNQISRTSSRKKMHKKIAPMIIVQEDSIQEDGSDKQLTFLASSEYTVGGVFSGGRPKVKLQRFMSSSRRANKMKPVRSFRIRLTTIYEGSVLLFNG